MGRHRSKWITAALTVASVGLWGAAFAAPGFGVDRDDISDCRGLGIAAVVLLGVWVITGPRIRRNEERLDGMERTWRKYREARPAPPEGDPGCLRRVGDRSA